MRKDANAGTVTCVIDGLDECDEDSVFLILDKLWRLDYDPRFRFLVLCRPLKPRQQLPAANPSVDILRLDSDADEEVNRDVFEFIRQRVQEIANSSPERKWPEKLRLHVEATLQRKAGGTFLWVGFVTQDLQRKTSTEVRQSLKSLPSDLNEIYDRILKDLPAEHRAQLRSLLHWITLAKRPMTLSELACLIDEPENAENATNSEAESDTEPARDYFEHLLDKYGSKAVSLEKGLLVQAIRYDDDPGFGVRRFSSALLAVATDARAIYGSELDQALIKAAKLPGVTEMIQVLVKKGADPNAADEEGNTALHYAAKRTDPAVQWLVFEVWGVQVRVGYLQ
ncbi:putative ankyrin repeat protein L92 like [Verticillium longisporum]|nr:putative ankyrin repeat protein L92 like [Verticillium longisporum]